MERGRSSGGGSYSAAQRAEIWDRVAEALRPDDHRDPYGVAEAKRLLARPSMARAVDEARPYRAYFPLGAPDRD